MNQLVTTITPAEAVDHDPETGEVFLDPPLEAAKAEPQAVVAEPVHEPLKRKFPLQPVLKEPEPSLPTPPADRIDPNWGIARFASRGAMHVERFFVMSEKLMWPSILMALLSVVLIFHALPTGGGMSGIGGGSLSNNPTGVFLALLPFIIIGAAIGAVVFTHAGYEMNEVALMGGAVTFGLPLAFIWYGGSSFPNSTAGSILSWVKIVITIGLVLWAGYHLLKIRRSGESRAVLWMAGAYVGVVITASIVLASIGAGLSGFGPGAMSAVASMLTFDRDSYFDLGGGLRSGPEHLWMGDYAPTGGLSVSKHNALIAAVRADYGKHANDAVNWEEVAKLDPRPLLTRAEKVIRDNAKELPNGIVIIPEDFRPISIIAHVEGQWSVSIVAGSGCAVVLGPFDPATECENATTPNQPLNGYVTPILDSIKPRPVVAETKE